MAGQVGEEVNPTPASLDDPLAKDRRAETMARKYVWWQPPLRALADRRTFFAQMMTLGSVDDVRWLLARVSEEDLCGVLRDPPVGVFNGRSWNFWHLRLGCEPVPELPARTLVR